MQMLTSTGDEELLFQGLSLNDSLQSVLVKHDAIASGSPLPTEVRDLSPISTERRSSYPRSTEARDPSPRSYVTSTSPIAVVASSQLEEEEEEDDDFAQLARRRTKNQVMPSESTPTEFGEGVLSSAAATATANPSLSNALALPDPPNPVKTTTKEQDMIDLLSITLSTSSVSPHTPHTPPSASNQGTHQVPVSRTTQGYPYGSQASPGYQGQASFNNYVAPWAQPQPRSVSQSQLQHQPQVQPQFPQYSYNYPPPPWATGPANSNENPSPATSSYPFPTPRAITSASYTPMNMARPSQNYNSFLARGENVSAVYREPQHMHSTQQQSSPPTGPKPFVPSYRLFEDLNVLGNSDAGHKTSTSPLSGMTGQSMVGGRK
ncbi:Tom1-like protein [Thalictrum thalictroides]|uniref:Tom1-like protein n=1 Tax=Thalictrum thalictroides TaxID=46969 RepID=A0A7J6VJW3_THATH|nr:Tom1-like protein [Thalictrum thalictroides]